MRNVDPVPAPTAAPPVKYQLKFPIRQLGMTQHLSAFKGCVQINKMDDSSDKCCEGNKKSDVTENTAGWVSGCLGEGVQGRPEEGAFGD